MPRNEAADRSDFVFMSLGDDAREIRLAFLPVVIVGVPDGSSLG